MIRNTVIGLVSAVALASAANAADLGHYAGGSVKDVPVYVVPDWSGFYAGINGGYGWSEWNDQFAYSFYGNPNNRFNGLQPEGGFGGGQIGYNWQGGGFSVFGPHFVLGIETDLEAGGISDLKRPQYYDNTRAQNLLNGKFESKADWFGTLRGRLGYGFNGTLIYATGGLAYAHVRNAAFDIGYANPLVADKTVTGYTVGGGVEFKFSPNWSVKAEYQYIDLGKNEPCGAVQFTRFDSVHEDAFQTVRLGLNYHFIPVYEPLK